MTAIYQMFFGWMPAMIQYVILGLLALLVVFVVVRIVIWVWDALPFV